MYLLCTEPQPTSSPKRKHSVAEDSPVDEPQVGLSMYICSLVPRPPRVYLLFAFTIIHGSGRRGKNEVSLRCIIVKVKMGEALERG